MENSFLNRVEIKKIGFKEFGENLKISRMANFYNPEEISIGNNVRIDDFCILSGNIKIGSYVHISAYTGLYGKFGIVVEDFVTISGRVLIYSQNDDYNGNFMTNPTVPEEFTNVTGDRVLIKKHSIVAAGSVLLPGITLNEGTAIGAMSLVKKDTNPWKIYAGVPAKLLKERKKELLKLEKELISKT